MKKIIIIFIILLWTNWLHAHDIKELSHPLKTWELKSEGKKLKGTFLLLKNGEVFIEDINHKVMKIPMNQLSADDWEYVLAKEKWINNINTSNKNKSAEEQINPYQIQFILVCLLLLTFSWLIFNRIQHHKKNYLDTLDGKHHNREVAFSYTIGNCSSNGMNEMNQNELVAVFPNPAQSSISVKLNNSEMIPVLRLMSLSGQIIQETISNEMDIKDITNGIYLLKVFSEGKSSTHKIIVLHD